jgi:hypothetical protein
MRIRSIYTNKRARMVILAIWIISLIVMSPLLTVNKYRVQKFQAFGTYNITMRRCIQEWDNLGMKLIFEAVLACFFFIFPSVFMLYAYYNISKVLWSKGNHQDNKLITSRRRIVKVLMIMILIFILTTLPYHVSNLYIDFVLFTEVIPTFDNTRKVESSFVHHFTQHIYPYILCLGN